MKERSEEKLRSKRIHKGSRVQKANRSKHGNKRRRNRRTETLHFNTTPVREFPSVRFVAIRPSGLGFPKTVVFNGKLCSDIFRKATWLLTHGTFRSHPFYCSTDPPYIINGGWEGRFDPVILPTLVSVLLTIYPLVQSRRLVLKLFRRPTSDGSPLGRRLFRAWNAQGFSRLLGILSHFPQTFPLGWTTEGHNRP